jgi:hypothetical protein
MSWLGEIIMRVEFATSIAITCSVASLVVVPPARMSPPADVCSLLTAPQISGAMGVAMGTPKAIGTKACQWRQPVKSGSPGAIVDVTIIDLNGYAMGKKAAGTFTITPVGGLGDEAYYSESKDGKLTSLRVRKGSAAFAVHVRGGPMPAAEAKPKELAVAKLIVSKF